MRLKIIKNRKGEGERKHAGKPPQAGGSNAWPGNKEG
jgi:hypothetical protein